MLPILIRRPHVPGHKETLVDILLNVFSKAHKESLKSLDAPEAGRQAALSAESRVNSVKERCVLAPPCPQCAEARRLTLPARLSG